MIEASWSVARWKDIFEIGGTMAAILFAGAAMFIDARARRAQTNIEITKQHRELWMYYDEHPELHRLFEKGRDMIAHPLADEEVRFSNFLFLHLQASFGAKRAKIHVLPEHVEDDWREIFTHPAVLAAWDKIRHLHDRRFVAVVES